MTDLFAAGFIIFLFVLVVWEKAFLEFRWREWTKERKDYLERLERRYDEFVSYVDKSHFGMIPSVSNPPEVVDPSAQTEQALRDEVEAISQKDVLTSEDMEKIASYEKQYGDKK